MFTWNRAEVLVTLSYDYYMQVRYLLKQQQITNQSRRVVIDAPAQASSSDMLQRKTIEYHLYVHKDDVEQVMALMQSIGPDSSGIA